MRSLFIFVSLLFCISTVAGAAESSFTQSDRDRMIRLETRVEDAFKATNQRIDDLNKRMEDGFKATNQRIEDTNKRIEDTNKRIDDIRGLLYVVLGGIFTLIVFVIWDRRTTLAPVVKTTRELETLTERLLLAIKEKAEKDPELKEALRHAGLQ
ncbi:MAG: hypothetical protein HQK89_02655 [Nitrospirae bacterium]|nr:hypothetical protein [Nitrospirota bacterium]